MKVINMTSTNGNPVPNQFLVDTCITLYGVAHRGTLFQSYATNIAFVAVCGKTFLDVNYWDYSVTTDKYRNKFLGETKKETQAKIDSGEYILIDLNA